MPGASPKRRVLLLYPEFPATYWGLQYSLPVIGRKSFMPPLGLLTVDADGLGEWVGRNRVAVIGMTDRNLADAIRAELTRQDSADTGHGPEDGPSKRGGSKT